MDYSAAMTLLQQCCRDAVYIIYSTVVDYNTVVNYNTAAAVSLQSRHGCD